MISFNVGQIRHRRRRHPSASDLPALPLTIWFERRVSDATYFIASANELAGNICQFLSLTIVEIIHQILVVPFDWTLGMATKYSMSLLSSNDELAQDTLKTRLLYSESWDARKRHRNRRTCWNICSRDSTLVTWTSFKGKYNFSQLIRYRDNHLKHIAFLQCRDPVFAIPMKGNI